MSDNAAAWNTNGADHLDGLDKLKVIRSEIPAVTHVDYSARVQTVHRETNPRFHALLTAFKAKTGCPVLVNTSFNVRGEPIACSPEDAFRCLMGTEIEMLVVGNCILYKDRQNPNSHSRLSQRVRSRLTVRQGAKFMAFLREFGRFIAARKKYWLVPAIVIMVAVGGLLVVAKGTVVGPLIYSLF